ncbi:hypothetical protein NE237_033185 [Protea cynaroides]|uniref:RING-type E3 ubiquitin transferase n=1 Tax=Protea cynaroides TaxID=273540 RepID=A0A9Q0R3T0_9MAGN|nr:hypothetical protein NE237_033185 [Protea cynaroides]
MSSDDHSGYYFDNDDDFKYSSVGKIIAFVAMIIILILIFLLAWRNYRRQSSEEALQTSINGVSATASEVVLHPSLITSLHTFIYKKPAQQLQTNIDKVEECPVCLSNLEEGDMVGLIPTCNHIFHCQCINMWLSSHSTCPVCRSLLHNPQPLLSIMT